MQFGCFPELDHSIFFPIEMMAGGFFTEWLFAYRNSENDSLTKCCFTVKAEGFLYHQVRYMMSVLFSVGLKQEAPHVCTIRDNLPLNQFIF